MTEKRLNMTKINRTRERFTKQLSDSKEKKGFSDLSPEAQHNLHYLTSAVRADGEVRAIEFEILILLSTGLTENNYNMADLTWEMIRREDDFHMYRKKFERVSGLKYMDFANRDLKDIINP